jgi:hypothetical protein
MVMLSVDLRPFLSLSPTVMSKMEKSSLPPGPKMISVPVESLGGLKFNLLVCGRSCSQVGIRFVDSATIGLPQVA